MWEALFKYPWVVFERGRLVWAPPIPPWVLVLLALVLLAVAAYALRGVRQRTTARDRAVLLGLRAALLAVVLFCLLRPTLLVPSAVPRQSYVGVLIDDSRSMRIADHGDGTRAEAARRAFVARESELVRALEDRFRVRLFRFSDELAALDAGDEPAFQGSRTRLAHALERARAELGALPLAGLVLVSDGADNADVGFDAPLLSLRAGGVPVYTVGVGQEQWERDVELSRVSPPRTVLQGATVEVDVVVSQTGYGGRTVRLVVEDEGRMVDQREVQLPAGGGATAVRVHFAATEPGARRFRFRIAPQQGEMVLDNNAREALIEVRPEPHKILYFEGEPRFEVKFLRRAVEEDEQLQVVVLQRTADNKFLRLAVDSAQELEGGFPATREELFGYRALILGSVEADFFSAAQMRHISDFVEERGGGLLMLGGRRSFAEGGYAGTPLADALPVELDGRRVGDSTYVAQLRVLPTPEGYREAALRLADDDPASRLRWDSLPALSTFNRVGGLKAGATALLTGSGPELPAGQVVLAHQRFGRGQTFALPVQNSWAWQMHASIPLEDQTHERFWRQLLRWLVSDVPDRVELAAAPERPHPGRPARLTATVRDGAFHGVDDADVVARVTAPSGAEQRVPMQWVATSQGEYRGTWTAGEEGVHEVVVEASRGQQPVATERFHLDASPDGGELFGAQMRAPLLRRIAGETGGRFYPIDAAAPLPEDVRYSGHGVTVTEEREIWDMPILFLLVVGLAAADWGFRRTRGLR